MTEQGSKQRNPECETFYRTANPISTSQCLEGKVGRGETSLNEKELRDIIRLKCGPCLNLDSNKPINTFWRQFVHLTLV